MNLAHGLGGGSDLPIPASLAVAGGTAALAVSFTVLLYAWRKPRFNDTDTGRPAPAFVGRVVDHPAFAWMLRLGGIVALAYVVLAAVAGKDLVTNPTFGIVYVWLWVGIVPASLLFGPWFKAISPARTVHLVLTRLTGGDPEQGLLPYPPRLGYWPAALGLLAFVWLELVSPGGVYLGPVRLWFAAYFAAMLLGSVLFGSRWLERVDPFEVYSTLVSRLSIWGRAADGSLVLRAPLRNLAGIQPETGLVAVVSVLLGSTAFDSFRSSTFWVQYSQETERSITTINSGLLVAACVVVGVTFTIATTVFAGRDRLPRWSHPAALAHSIVPIIVGYMIAHYLSFFVEYGQQTLIQASDPLGTGDNLFGTADWDVNYWLSQNPSLLALIKVSAIVTGHVLGVVAAHDRSLQILPRRRELTGQLPLLLAMTLYTFSGLYLLFGL